MRPKVTSGQAWWASAATAAQPHAEDPSRAMPPGFGRIWAALATMAVGARVTRQVLPILAVTTLGANAAQISFLHGLLFLPGIVVGLVAGRAISYVGPLQALRVTLLMRAILLALVPTLHAFGLLGFAGFCGVVLCLGALSTLSEIAERSLIPLAVPADWLVPANARLASTDAAAEIVGPIVMGLLLVVLAPANALLVDAACFLIALTFLARLLALHPAGARPGPAPATGQVADVGQLSRTRVRQLWAQPAVRYLALALAASTLGSEWMRALYTVHALTVLALTPLQIGLTFAAGGFGLLVGSFLARRPVFAGNIRAMAWFLGLNALGLAFFPVAGTSCCGGMAWLVAGQFISDTGLIAFLILARSHLQRIVPSSELPSLFALLSMSTGIMIAVGVVGAGALGSIIGLSGALCAPPAIKLLTAAALGLSARTKGSVHD